MATKYTIKLKEPMRKCALDAKTHNGLLDKVWEGSPLIVREGVNVWDDFRTAQNDIDVMLRTIYENHR